MTELKDSQCDPLWMGFMATYEARFRVEGSDGDAKCLDLVVDGLAHSDTDPALQQLAKNRCDDKRYKELLSPLIKRQTVLR